MDFRFSAEDERFRQEVRDFLRTELPPNTEEDEDGSTGDAWERGLAFHKRLAARGWLVGFWPKEYGGQEWPYYRQLILNEEMALHRAPRADHCGIAMAAPVIITHGTPEQKRRHLPPIANAEIRWAQLFSEPNAGSDLASLQTRATENGDEFIITGQKIWNSLAHRSQWGILLARTDPTAPKHKGISYFLVDLGLPGVTIRPIINMAGVYRFNEVFFDNVRVPRSCLVGQKNQGWYIGANTLNIERSAISGAAASLRMVQDLIDYARNTTWAGRSILSVNPAIRHQLAELQIEVQLSRLLSYRVAWMQTARVPFSYEASIGKVFTFELAQRIARVGMRLTGLYGQIAHDSPRSPVRGKVNFIYHTTVASTIGGGSSEIQRTTIAQRGLGLPRG